MSNSKIIAVVAVVAVVAVAAAAVFLTMGPHDDPNEVKFLVQDDKGVYFWIDGSGETVFDAFKDAATDYNIPVTYSVYQGAENGIQKMFGLEMTQDQQGNWSWWSQYSWDGTGWVSNEVTMDNLVSKNTKGYIAVVYGDGTYAPLVKPSDCVVWNKSTSGTVFTIESSSGMWFKVNGTGTTVYDAFLAVVEQYKIPFVASSGMAGISALFGLAMLEDPDNPGAWDYWVQKEKNAGEWVDSNKGMDQLNVADHPEFKVVYAHFVFA